MILIAQSSLWAPGPSELQVPQQKRQNQSEGPPCHFLHIQVTTVVPVILFGDKLPTRT